MNAISASSVGAPRRRARIVIWLMVGAGLVALALANTHLVLLAVLSQPSCVAHLQPGEGDARKGLFSVAESACTPDSLPAAPTARGPKP
jgi:hypothetical protein